MRLYGKELLKQRLDDIAAKGRLPHAILFSGNEGSGRKTLAKYTAQLFLCKEHQACGECVTCRNIESDNHPDVIFVKRKFEGKYTADAFRDILAESVRKPLEGDIKILVIEDCDSMNITTFNTLLKLVEEPPSHLRFIFTCRNTAVIPITVMSRVTEFEVPDMSAEDCARCLTDMGTDPKKAKELSLMFSGNAAKCQAALQDGSNELKLIDAAAAAASAIGKRSGFGLAAALAGQTNREDFAQVLDLLAGIIRDALALKCSKDLEFFGKKEAEKIAAEFSETEIASMLNAIFELEKNEIYNLNLALSGVYLTSKIFN